MRFLTNLKNNTVRVGKRLVGYQQIATGTKENYEVFKDIFKYNFTENKDTEPEVYLSRQAVIEAQKSFKKLVVVFLFLFIVGLLYSLGNFITKNWSIGFLALAFSALCLTLTFRYHFWLYQIKNRILGASFADYYQAELKGFFTKTKSQIKKDEK